MASTSSSGVFPVIMAGGSGTRFWPLSRVKRPKQFLPLATKHPLIVDTFSRLKGLASAKQSFVVCGAAHAPMVKKALPALPKQNVLVEPQARNTAPAIALATAHVAKLDPNGIVVVMPSDQHVADVPAFQASLVEAITTAREGHIVTLGIHPTRPETGYGYIHVGEPLAGAPGRRVSRFAEKPDRATAEQYLLTGEYLWNAGIFVFRADVMLEAFRLHMPELSTELDSLRAALGTKKEAAVLKRAFARMPATSIDYGVAERASNIAVVPSRCGWSDVGSFNALPDVRATDAQGNVSVGKNVIIDSSGCVVLGGDKPVAVVGMNDVVVVDAGDAMLVLPKDRSQDVRKVVEALKAQKRLALL